MLNDLVIVTGIRSTEELHILLILLKVYGLTEVEIWTALKKKAVQIFLHFRLKNENVLKGEF